jgi:phosphate starvation-inducible PhoH-like protein
MAGNLPTGSGGPDHRAPSSDSDADWSPRPWGEDLSVYVGGRPVRARTANQKIYLDAIRDHDLVFGLGPAGTGKTYLAVAAAVHMLRTENARKVILVRPAVEAGERLGFLPGDLQQKVNPYLRPLLDALNDMVDFATIKRFMMNDVVEVIPLAYMRGRTLNQSIIILDEAQNTTRGQMQMFLTRMGNGSKMIITGDPSQIDLPDPRESGLLDAARRLARVPGVSFIHMGQEDIVRHPLVQRIVEAYADPRPDAASSFGMAPHALHDTAGKAGMRDSEKS